MSEARRKRQSEIIKLQRENARLAMLTAENRVKLAAIFEEREADIVSELASGGSFDELAKEFLVTRGVIAGIAFRHGGTEAIRASREKNAA